MVGRRSMLRMMRLAAAPLDLQERGGSELSRNAMIDLIGVLPRRQARRGVRPVLASALILTLTCLLPLLCSRPAAAQTGVIVQNDFENGTVQAWIPRGSGVSLTNTTAVAHGGTHSLLTTGRTAGYNGPSLNLLRQLTAGSTYQVTVWARLVTGQTADTLKITMQHTPTGGSNAFDTIAKSSTSVTDSAWVQLTGLYSFTGDVSGLVLYVEAAGAATQYYIDDFSITFLTSGTSCPDPPDTTGIHTNFEDNTTEGWKPRIGTEVLTVTNADAHTGVFSLLTTNRQHTYEGPAINAAGKFCNGSRYRVSVWVKLAPGEPSTQLRVSLQRNIGTITSYHTVVGNTTVTADQWVRLTDRVQSAAGHFGPLGESFRTMASGPLDEEGDAHVRRQRQL